MITQLRKFRARSIIDGAWKYGNLAWCTATNVVIRDERGQDWTCTPGTEGQFTDRKDCDGADIYEGDILPSSIAGNVVVEWGTFTGHLKGFPSEVDELEMTGWCMRHPVHGLQPLDASFCEGAIQGNVFDNPDLVGKV